MRRDRPIGPYLYLPIEIASRELDAKLLLTHFAVRMGYEVVVGWRKLMNQNLRHMPPGIVLFKTMTSNDGAIMRRARAAGHVIGAIDEEVPGLVTTVQGLRWVAPESVAGSDLIFAAGQDHLEAISAMYPERADACRVVGNPRWDLLRPELRGGYAERAAVLRETYGRFILINTNFACTNSVRRTPEETREWFPRAGRFDPDKPEDMAILDQIFEMERLNTETIRALVRALPSRFPEHRIIVRPHPMERAEPWDELLRDVPRAEMVREGPAAAWILASDVLVHTNCTTGVEAFALDKPTISIQPADLDVYGFYLSNRINYVTRDVESTLRKLDELIGPGSRWSGWPQTSKAAFDHFLAAGHGPFACERILDVISKECELRPSSGTRPAWRPDAGYLPRRRTRKHHVLVMPEIDAATVKETLERFGAALGATQPLHVEPCGQLMFHVHGAAERANHVLPSELGARLRRLWPSRNDGATKVPA
jgi:surface carbohydrate biosynthesis protein